jgi:hypothetical protein
MKCQNVKERKLLCKGSSQHAPRTEENKGISQLKHTTLGTAAQRIQKYE